MVSVPYYNVATGPAHPLWPQDGFVQGWRLAGINVELGF
jgi:hypothetical protein